MRSKWNLIASVCQILVGLAAIAAFIVIAVNGEHIGKWIVTLILAVGYVAVGIMGLLDYRSQKKE
ncbi:MAG: hypothetical protein II723_06450 [Oscillospiraceae bacterium]|nr:hypothetical protein [Oscillospiraceae bacterium]